MPLRIESAKKTILFSLVRFDRDRKPMYIVPTFFKTQQNPQN